jgi:hypothetical protein
VLQSVALTQQTFTASGGVLYPSHPLERLAVFGVRSLWTRQKPYGRVTLMLTAHASPRWLTSEGFAKAQSCM